MHIFIYSFYWCIHIYIGVYIYIFMYMWFLYIQLLLRILYSSSISFVHQHLLNIHNCWPIQGIFQHMNPQKKTRQRQGWDDLVFVGPWRLPGNEGVGLCTWSNFVRNNWQRLRWKLGWKRSGCFWHRIRQKQKTRMFATRIHGRKYFVCKKKSCLTRLIWSKTLGYPPWNQHSPGKWLDNWKMLHFLLGLGMYSPEIWQLAPEICSKGSRLVFQSHHSFMGAIAVKLCFHV